MPEYIFQHQPQSFSTLHNYYIKNGGARRIITVCTNKSLKTWVERGNRTKRGNFLKNFHDLIVQRVQTVRFTRLGLVI